MYNKSNEFAMNSITFWINFTRKRNVTLGDELHLLAQCFILGNL